MGRTIEQEFAAAILQKPLVISIGGVSYEVAPPTLGTLILVSEVISLIPSFDFSSKKILTTSLSIAKDCRVLAEILAILVLGSKGLRKTEIVEKKYLFGLIRIKKRVCRDLKKEYAERFIHEVGTVELIEKTTTLLHRMETDRFFGFTASLAEVSLLRTTTEAEMIASGR